MSNAILNACRDVLQSDPQIVFAVLFGSGASGRLARHSDADIGVADRDRMSLDRRTELAATLALQLGREVDLVDLQSVSGVILQQALCTGTIILSRDAQVYAALMKKMLYNQADMMPYYRRILRERRERFLHES